MKWHNAKILSGSFFYEKKPSFSSFLISSSSFLQVFSHLEQGGLRLAPPLTGGAADLPSCVSKRLVEGSEQWQTS